MASALNVVGLSVALPPGAERPLAIEDVSFGVALGETLCLIGRSGSGKSVLAAALMAALPKGLRVTSGHVALRGQQLTGLSEAQLQPLRGNRIALVPQNPVAALNPLMAVGRQIEEVLTLHSEIGRAARGERVAALLADVGLGAVPGLAARFPHQLSGGQCQRVAIAMALAMAPDVLIADEPTTALDTIAQAQIVRLLADLQARTGHALVFISHDVAVVAGIADRIGVIDAGCLVEIGPAHELLVAPRHAATKALLASNCLPPRRPQPPPLAQPSPVVLQVRGLAKRYAGGTGVADIDLDLHRAMTLAVVGPSGSGKSTLARLIVQIVAADSGTITIGGANVLALRGRTGRQARGRAQMIFQDSLGAFNPFLSIGDSVARAAVLAGATRAQAAARTAELLGLVGLQPAMADRKPAALSGGQLQRIGLARALAMTPAVLICDESVSGLDPVAEAEILALLGEVQAKTGVAIMFITHDLLIAATIGDRIAVMDGGRIVEIGEAKTLLAAPQSPVAQALVAAMPSLG